MYEAHYGMNRKPFALSPDPMFLYEGKEHSRALRMIQYGLVNHAGFTVVTGEIGCGKTTLIRKLLRDIDETFTVGVVSNTQCESFEELLRWILLAFDLEYKGKEKVELFESFTAFLVEEYAAGRRTVLIIDEAQNLSPDSLEQLRMVSNVNVDDRQLLQLLVVGQPDLWHLLQRPELTQFVQRIGAEYHLVPLEMGEARSYIRHRVRVAGGAEDVFAEDTYALIWHVTRGVPRLINLVCDIALVYGFAEGCSRIEKRLVEEVLRDKSKGLSALSTASSGPGGPFGGPFDGTAGVGGH